MRRNIHIFALLCVCLPAFPFVSNAMTQIGGIIATDMVIRAEDGPFHVTESIVVADGATLTIDAGSDFLFDSKRALAVTEGTLVALGTERHPIRMRAYSSGWGYVGFGNLAVDAILSNDVYVSGSVLCHVIVEDAGDTESRAALHVENAAPLIESSQVLRSQSMGLYLAGSGCSGLNVRHSRVIQSQHSGVILTSAGMGVAIQDCIVSRSGGGGISMQLSGGVHIVRNLVVQNEGSGISLWEVWDAVIQYSTISKNNGGGVFLRDGSSSCMMGGNEISQNTSPLSGSGIRIDFEAGRSAVVLSEHGLPNRIINNSPLPQLHNESDFQFSSEFDGAGNVDARNTYWEHPNATNISDHIFGFRKDASKGIVFTDGALEPYASANRSFNGAQMARTNGETVAEMTIAANTNDAIYFVERTDEMSSGSWRNAAVVFASNGVPTKVSMALDPDRISRQFYRISPVVLKQP